MAFKKIVIRKLRTEVSNLTKLNRLVPSTGVSSVQLYEQESLHELQMSLQNINSQKADHIIKMCISATYHLKIFKSAQFLK